MLINLAYHLRKIAICTLLLLLTVLTTNAQQIKVIAGPLTLSGYADTYNSNMEFTGKGDWLLLQHGDDTNLYSAMWQLPGGKQPYNTAVLSHSNQILCFNSKHTLFVSRFTGRKLSTGHYFYPYTAVFDDSGQQLDSIPLQFRYACFLNDNSVLGLSYDSVFVYQPGKGIARKAALNKRYGHNGHMLFTAGKVFQLSHNIGEEHTRLQIINPAGLTEKTIELPGKYDEMDADDAGNIWLSYVSGKVFNFKTNILCFDGHNEKIAWQKIADGAMFNWALDKGRSRLIGPGYIVSKDSLIRFTDVIPAFKLKIIKATAYQEATGRVLICCADNELMVLNIRTGTIENDFIVDASSPMAQEKFKLQWHPTKNQIAFCVRDKAKKLTLGVMYFDEAGIKTAPVNPNIPVMVMQQTHNVKPTAMAFNRDGSWMISGDMSGLVNVWDVKSRLIYNKIYLGKNDANNFTSDSRLAAAIHPTQKMFAVSIISNYVYLLNFDGNMLDKIPIDGYCNLLYFTDDGESLIMETDQNVNRWARYDIAQKRITEQYTRPSDVSALKLTSETFNQCKYYFDENTRALKRINLITGKQERSTTIPAGKKIVNVAVSPNQSAAVLLTENLGFWYIDLLKNEVTKLDGEQSYPMGYFKASDGPDRVEVPEVTFFKFNNDNRSVSLQLAVHDSKDAFVKHYGVCALSFDLPDKRLVLNTYEQTIATVPATVASSQPNSDYLWAANADGSINIWDVKLAKLTSQLKGYGKYPAILAANNAFDGFVVSMRAEDIWLDLKKTEDFLRFDFAGAQVNNITQKGFEPDFIYPIGADSLLTNSLDDLLLIDFDSKRAKTDTSFFYRNKIELSTARLLYAKNTQQCYYNAKNQSLYWFDNGKPTKQAHFPVDMPLTGRSRFEMNKFSFSADSTILYARFEYVQFDDKGMYQTSQTNAYYQYDLKTGQATKLHEPGGVKNLSEDYLCMAGSTLIFELDKKLYRFNFPSAHLDSATFKKPVASVGLPGASKPNIYTHGKFAIAFYMPDTLRKFDNEYPQASVYSLDGLKCIANFSLKYNQVNSVTFSRDDRLCYVLYHSEVEIRDILSGSLVATLTVLPNNNFIIYTPDGYYYASNKLTDIAFRANGRVYDISQFDLKYNRPDIVLQKLGYATPELIELYKKAYLKRLQRAGVKNIDDDNTNAPQIELLNRQTLPAKTNQAKITLIIKASAVAGFVDRLNLRVNGAPVYGADGYKPTNKQAQNFTGNFTIELMAGVNRIQYNAVNTGGVKSLTETIEINYEPLSPKKAKVYFAGIGVAHYKNAAYNLKYADKDITDLARMIAFKFPDTDQSVLLNEDATLPNIKKLKQKLMQTTVNDMIIICVSGHGLLNKESDFYYATYETNFADPTTTALSYKDIEWLLDGVPARRKLVMIDACHSGETDKNDLANTTQPMAADVKKIHLPGQTKGVDIANSKPVNATASFAIMQNLFIDVNESSGAVIISASAGDEYALESSKWNNGVFTYAVRSALEHNEADMDKDGRITISELRRFVYNTVAEQTGGRQKPTTRQDNLDFDWQVW